MKSLGSIILLVACMVVLSLVSGGCTGNTHPPGDSVDSAIEEESSPENETAEPEPVPEADPAPESKETPEPEPISPDEQEVEGLTVEDIKETILRAQEAAFTMAVAGFEEELSGDEKKPFSYYEPTLRDWYADELVLGLEDFYDHYLKEWGFEMGFAFPLHQRERVDEGFAKILEQTPDKVTAMFYAEVNYEEMEALIFTLERQSDNRWVVTSMSCGC